MPTKIGREELDQKIASFVMTALGHLDQLRKDADLYTKWDSYDSAYNNNTGDYYKGRSRVEVPALHQAVERIVPKMDKVNFPTDGEFLTVKADNKKNDIQVDQAEAFTKIIKKQLEKAKVRKKMIGTYRSLCIYGTVFIKTYWNYKRKFRYGRDVNGKRIPAWETVEDNPDFVSPQIRDIFVDPKDENLEGTLIERMIVDYQSIFDKRIRMEEGNKVGIYRNTEDLQGQFFTQETTAEKKNEEDIKGLANHKYGAHEKKLVKYEYWGAVPKYFITGLAEDMASDEMVDNQLIEVVSSSTDTSAKAVLLRMIDNPFDHQEKPYSVGRYISVQGSLYGLGVMSVNIPLQAELNTLRNQLMDMRTFILKKKWLLDRSAGISPDQLEDVNNLVIEADDIQGIKEVSTQDFAGSGIAQEQNIKQDIDDSTGASKLLGGTAEKTSLERTAAGVATVVQSGLERFELVASQFEEEIMKPLVKQFWMLDQQFLTDAQEIVLSGNRQVTVDPTKIAIPDFTFIGVKEIGEKGFKINALNILLQNLTPFMQLGFNPLPLLERFIKLLGFGELKDELFPTEISQLEQSPEGEVQLLQAGKTVRIDFGDNHPAYIQAYMTLVPEFEGSMQDPDFLPNFMEALEKSELPDNIKRNVKNAMGQRLMALSMVSQLQKDPQKGDESVQR